MTYTHTAADALALAATCEKRIAAGTGVALNPAATDMVAKALKFWAEHNQFSAGDVIEHRNGVVINIGSWKVKDVRTETKLVIEVTRHDGTKTTVESASQFYELAAGHRIDNQDSIKCWSCEAFIELEQLKNNDGFCPECNAEIENDEVQDD